MEPQGVIGLAAGIRTKSGPHDSSLVKEPTRVASMRTKVGTLDIRKELTGL